MANLRPVVLLACALTLLVPLNLHANQLLLEAGFEPPACSDSTWVQTSATYACVNAVTHSGSWSL